MVKKVAIVCAGKNMKYFGIFGALKPCGFSAYGCRAKACCALADGSGNKDFDRSLRWVEIKKTICFGIFGALKTCGFSAYGCPDKSTLRFGRRFGKQRF